MQTTFALAALASVAFAIPQGGPSNKAPTAAAPAGCSTSFADSFQIRTVNASTPAVAKRVVANTCGQEGLLTAKLADGVLTDTQGRIGSIVANYQFQFDGPPPQAGAIYTAGWSVCQNNSLALGGSTIFYSCQSGDFSNLYDRSWAPQCKPVYIEVLPCAAAGTAPVATQIADGQPQAPTAVTQIGDGQLQGPTGVSQISDGQVQAPTTAKPAVTQISDGQVQVPTTAPVVTPVTQIGDGQVQAPTTANAPVVTQIPDGQVQAPTTAPVVAPVTQIPDGQVQVPTVAPNPVTQIPDGQLQVPTVIAPAPTVVSQLPDGQVNAPNNVTTTPTPSAPVTVINGASGPVVAGSISSFVVAFAAVLLL